MRAQLSDIAPFLYSTLETQQNSFDIAQYVVKHDIKGDIVECGIAAGGNFASMMLGALSLVGQTDRLFWGFDSFEGIQLAGKHDTEQAGIGPITHNTDVDPKELLVSSGITSYSMEQVYANMKSWGLHDSVQYNLVKGWVQNTITKELADFIGAISILRLDMDVYDPTMHALDMLYDNISVRGVIIIDDWALDGVRKCCEDFWEKRGIKPDLHTIPNSTPIYWFKS